jgi:predicted RNA-binding protein with PIN domain
MHLIIDGYNLLHADRTLTQLSSIELQQERDRLIHQLSIYRQLKACEITVVFDGWQGGWNSEKKERTKGIELIFSKLGEKADEVIKRLVKGRGPGAIVITSDREVSRYGERMAVAVIPSQQFKEKLERTNFRADAESDGEEDGGRGLKRKGPSKMLSKKEKRLKAALRKI